MPVPTAGGRLSQATSISSIRSRSHGSQSAASSTSTSAVVGSAADAFRADRPGGGPSGFPLADVRRSARGREERHTLGVAFLQPWASSRRTIHPCCRRRPSWQSCAFLVRSFIDPSLGWPSGVVDPGARRGMNCVRRSACRPLRTIRCLKVSIHRYWFWRCSHRCLPPSSRIGLDKPLSPVFPSLTRMERLSYLPS